MSQTNEDISDFNPATEDSDASINESMELMMLAQRRMDNFFNGGLSAEDEARYNILELRGKIRDMYDLEKEKEDFANKMTVAISAIKENSDLLVSEDNYKEMKELSKNLKDIMSLFGSGRQKELRDEIKAEISDVIEEIEILAPNNPMIDELFETTDADQLVKQKISNYITYKFNLNGIDSTISKLKKNLKVIKKLRQNEQPQNFFSSFGQSSNTLSEDIDTKKTFYIYHIKLGTGVLGYGITSSPKRRHKEHLQNFADNGVLAEKVFQYRDDSQVIEKLESTINNTFPSIDIGIDGFKNEATSYKYLDEILDLIDNLDEE